MNKIMTTVFGSKLYGLDTPTSDTDYKGIYLPTLDELLLGSYKKSINLDSNKKDKNRADDVDMEWIALPYFIELACKGETVALDMLHSDQVELHEFGHIWGDIVRHRGLFYTKGIKSYAGYLKSQIHKYSGKGKKLGVLKSLIAMLNAYSDTARLSDIWNVLPTGEYTEKGVLDAESRMKEERYWMVMGSKYTESITVKYCKEQLKKKADGYGKRAQKAKDAGGVDWKAVTHGLRAGYQLIEIYKNGGFTYPLKQTDFLKEVKAGKHDFQKVVEPELKRLLIEIDDLVEVSVYPERTDREFWNEWLLNVYYYDLVYKED